MKNKFVNPKGLKGNQRIDRMKDLMGIKPITESVITTKALENLKYGPDGKTYGIVRENKKYFIKRSDKTTNVTLNDLDYIGGLGNKLDESFTSYNDAIRRLNLKFNELNDFHSSKEGINIIKKDDVITEEIDEQRYKIKVPAPAAPVPAPEEEPMEDELGEIGMEDELEPLGDDEIEGDDEDEEDIIKAIQKLTGKLGQKIREADAEEMNSEMTKYVLNSTMSALDLSLLSEEDIEEAIERLEAGEEQLDDELGGEEEEGGMEEPMGDEFPEEAGEEEMELAEEKEAVDEEEEEEKPKKKKKSKSAPKSTKKSNTKAFYEGGTIVGESKVISKQQLLETISEVSDDYYEEDYEHVDTVYEKEEAVKEDCNCGDTVAEEELVDGVFNKALEGNFYGDESIEEQSPQPAEEPGERTTIAPPETDTPVRKNPKKDPFKMPNTNPNTRPKGVGDDIRIDGMDDIHFHLNNE